MLLLGVLDEVQQHVRATVAVVGLEEARERGHALVAVEGAEDELAARAPDAALWHRESGPSGYRERPGVGRTLTEDGKQTRVAVCILCGFIVPSW